MYKTVPMGCTNMAMQAQIHPPHAFLPPPNHPQMHTFTHTLKVIYNMSSNNAVLCVFRVVCSTFVAQMLTSNQVQFVTNDSSLSSSRDGTKGDQKPDQESGHHSTVRQRKAGDLFIGWLFGWLVSCFGSGFLRSAVAVCGDNELSSAFVPFLPTLCLLNPPGAVHTNTVMSRLCP